MLIQRVNLGMPCRNLNIGWKVLKVKQTISCGTGNRGHDLSLHPCTNDDEEWPTTAPIPLKPPPPTPTPTPLPTQKKAMPHLWFVLTL